ncbi:hypothetical protein GCM10017608_28200 [Agromyces luteolus]|uniref:Uncharacterized protein n=1 Tax=Agromyces luteolus TaxID=88373 RepID=A0A7C9LW86_9MICO|nr:DUF6518 family protein [Agromyces luteolus]MUN06077.1 hypothetical protein [Agromyces luteolus]GLK28885.1 hypothetical protein GCM10017608_28200 [Agromyces luteolus]
MARRAGPTPVPIPGAGAPHAVAPGGMAPGGAAPPATARAPRHPWFAAARRILLVAAIAFVLGGLTSWGQLVLPPETASLANSAGGWTVPTAILVLLLARGYPEAAVAGAGGFVALTLGYAVASGWRGIAFDPTTWAIIGALAGPVIGCAAHAMRRRGMQLVLGTSVLAGVLVGEGVYGLTVVADTTSGVWWWIELVLGAGVLVAGALRARPWGLALVALTGTLLVAGLFWSAFVLLPILVFRG